MNRCSIVCHSGLRGYPKNQNHKWATENSENSFRSKGRRKSNYVKWGAQRWHFHTLYESESDAGRCVWEDYSILYVCVREQGNLVPLTFFNVSLYSWRALHLNSSSWVSLMLNRVLISRFTMPPLYAGWDPLSKNFISSLASSLSPEGMRRRGIEMKVHSIVLSIDFKIYLLYACLLYSSSFSPSLFMFWSGPHRHDDDHYDQESCNSHRAFLPLFSALSLKQHFRIFLQITCMHHAWDERMRDKTIKLAKEGESETRNGKLFLSSVCLSKDFHRDLISRKREMTFILETKEIQWPSLLQHFLF